MNIEKIMNAVDELTIEDRKALLDRMRSEVIEEVNAKAADDAKKSRLARLDAAMASTDPAVSSSAKLCSAMLARAGITREQVAEGLVALDKAFAANNKLTIAERLQIKALLARHSAI
jgi:hypothetical protein